MKRNEVVNEMEQEDIVCDYDVPDNSIQDEQYEKVEKPQLKIVAVEVDQNVESNQNEIEPSEEIKSETEASKFETLDTLIAQLPDQFPAASEAIKNQIAPLLIDYDPGVVDHYIKVIKKRANAASIKSVSLLIDEAIEKSNSKKTISYEVNPGIETTVDPEIGALTDQIALDP